MADDSLLAEALDAFDIYVVGETPQGERILSRDGRTPVDDTVVFLESAPDKEMTVTAAEQQMTGIIWMMEPEVAVMTAAANGQQPTPPAPAEPVPARDKPLLMSDLIEQSDFTIMAETRSRQAHETPAVSPSEQTPEINMPASNDMTETPEAEQAAADMGDTPETPAVDSAEFGQMLDEAERRLDQIEGLVASMVMDDVRDETFDQTPGGEQVLPEPKMGSLITVAYQFGDIADFVARTAAMGVAEVTPDMQTRLEALVDRLDKLESTITEMMDEAIEDEELEEEEDEDEAPESEQTVIDETVPDDGAKTAAFFVNRRGVRVWHDPTTGKFAPAGFVSPKLLARLWRGDSKAGMELDDAVRTARRDAPDLDLDGVAAKVLGPRPSDALKGLHWDSGRRRIGTMWKGTRPVSRPGLMRVARRSGDGDQSVDMVQAERSDGLVFPNGNPKKIDWPGDLPACDICGKPAPFDLPTSGSGRWANLCPDHGPEFGAQTSIGFERVKPGMGDPSPSERMDAATREMLTAAGLTEEDMDLFDGDLIDMDFVQADNSMTEDANTPPEMPAPPPPMTVKPRVQTRRKKYRQQDGFEVSGTDAKGRKIRMFFEDESQAREVARQIKAGETFTERSPYTGRDYPQPGPDARGEQSIDMVQADNSMAEDLQLSTVSLGTSTALNYLRTRFPNLGRPGWNTTGRPDREVVADLVAEAFSDKGLDVGFLDDAVAEVLRVLAQYG